VKENELMLKFNLKTHLLESLIGSNLHSFCDLGIYIILAPVIHHSERLCCKCNGLEIALECAVKEKTPFFLE
jgi:hypothetical protein